MKKSRIANALARSLLTALFATCAHAATPDNPPVKLADCRQTKDLDRAIAACSEAIRVNSQDSQALVGRAFAYFLKFDYDRAFADYEEAIRHNPKEADAYHFRGVIFQIKGNDDRAIADFTKALDLGSKDSWILLDRGSTFLLKGAAAQSIADYSAAIKNDPNNWIAYLLRGVAYTYGAELEKAQADFKRGAELDPKVPYFPIWLYIAERRAETSSLASAHLASAVGKLDMTKWPAQVVRLFLGEETPAAVLARGTENVKVKHYGDCESTFFVAEYRYLQNQRDEALRLYKSAQQACSRNFVEGVAATAALRSLVAAETGPRVHNLAPAFLEYWARVESKPVAEQVQRFKTEVLPTFPEFYEYKIGKWRAAGRESEAALAKELAAFPAIRAAFEKKTLEISRDLEATIASFVKALPDLDRNFDVYVVHSLNDMDGGTRQIDGKTYFILGIDGMVRYHQGASSEVPFFHHELFHMYHGQYLAETEQIWLALWMEGLATYASQKLNPGATYQDMLLDLPSGMVPAIDSKLAWHWKHLSARLDSTDPGDYAMYFQNSSKQSDVVGRSGYYLGYKVAAEVGKTMTLSQMAQLKAADVYPLVKATVQTLSKRAGNDE